MTSHIIQTDSLHLVLGMGATGLSVARHLCRQGLRVAVMDSRPAPPNADAFAELPLVYCHRGSLPGDRLAAARVIYPSPGLALSTPSIQQAINQGVQVASDIELFFAHFASIPSTHPPTANPSTANPHTANPPTAKPLIKSTPQPETKILAVTGSNGKSSLCAWLGEMAQAAGWSVAVGGNFGLCALDILAEHQQHPLDMIVLELSSFQLELLTKVPADVVTVLNVTPDHLDRYPSFEAYLLAKHRIFRQAKAVVANAQDPRTQPLLGAAVPVHYYQLGEPDLHQWGIRKDQQGREYFAKGLSLKWPLDQLRFQGQHHTHNALAAIALASHVGLPEAAIAQALSSFNGLEHRCEWVADIAGVRYINDSKGTNTGATRAALDSLGPLCTGRLWWIAGGQLKETDFTELRQSVERWVFSAVFYGEDQQIFAENFANRAEACYGTLEEALAAVATQVQPEDWVLFSPSAASFDQFDHFIHRGQVFKTLVLAMKTRTLAKS